MQAQLGAQTGGSGPDKVDKMILRLFLERGEEGTSVEKRAIKQTGLLSLHAFRRLVLPL